MLERLPSHLNGRSLNPRRAEASYVFCVKLLSCVAQFHDFERPLLVSCTISHVIINIQYLKTHVQLQGRSAAGKYTDAENLALQELQCQKIGICSKFPGEAGVSHDIISAVWRVRLMLVA
jgi:hypothetical protein